VIVPAFPGTLLLSEWIATKAIPGKIGTNHIPALQTPSLPKQYLKMIFVSTFFPSWKNVSKTVTPSAYDLLIGPLTIEKYLFYVMINERPIFILSL